jgi:hypothetical protein
MERFERISERVSLGLAVFVITAAAFKHEIFHDLVGIIAPYVGVTVRAETIESIVAAMVLSAVFAFVEIGMHYSAGNYRWFRKCLFGPQDIEGFWVDVVRDVDSGAVLNGAFLSIDYEQGEFKVKGDEWDQNGKHLYAFESLYSRYEGRVLKFVFGSSAGGSGKVEGNAELSFAVGRRKPTAFTGFYAENGTGKEAKLVGTLARKFAHDDEREKLSDFEVQRKMVVRYLSEIKH